MKKSNPKQKKIFISVIALVLVAAIGVGIWFGARGSAEPVNVYPFDYVGMTEYWGDNQESYGPVSTDKIQTVYLTDTQTVTEVVVSEGDEVKKGDVLMTFDTTLTELELERKRLDVEKQKLDLQDAQAQLRKIRNMKPMDPDAMNPVFPEPEEPDLGDVLVDRYKISEKQEYDGSEVQKALICWMKDGTAVNDALLRAIQEKALQYQEANKDKENSSAAAEPENDISSLNESEDDNDPDDDNQGGGNQSDGNGGGTTGSEGGNGGGTTGSEGGNGGGATGSEGGNGGGTTGSEDGDGEGTDGTEGDGEITPDETYSIPVIAKYYDDGSLNASVHSETISYVEVTKDGRTLGISEFIPRYWNGSTYEAKQILSYGASVTIPAYPQSGGTERDAWLQKWGEGITVAYVRGEPKTRVGEFTIQCSDSKVTNGGTLTVKAGEKVDLTFTMKPTVSNDSDVEWGIRSEAEGVLTGISNNNAFTVSGTPTQLGECKYTVVAAYKNKDANTGDEEIAIETFEFTLKTEDNMEEIEDFYVIIKVTEDNRERGNRLIWQGLRVLCYPDGSFGFTLFDASVLEDHTLEALEDNDEDVELPDIDFGSGYTLAEIVKMRSEQEKKVKEQELALRMAEAEFKIMQAEVNDGKICADFDGQVVSAISEEDARQEKRPILKVSAGGGFYVSGSVSELEKDKVEPGLEVTINDWNTGMSYTGKVESIGDFPVTSNSWSSENNPNATYYPFTVFVDSSADLQEGSYVSVTYSTSSGENGIYLENPFVRTEQGRSYVCVRGENGRLEKRYVTVGKSLFGSYTEILDGLSAEDFVAFPYGKTVKEGAPTVESDYSTLYAY